MAHFRTLSGYLKYLPSFLPHLCISSIPRQKKSTGLQLLYKTPSFLFQVCFFFRCPALFNGLQFKCNSEPAPILLSPGHSGFCRSSPLPLSQNEMFPPHSAAVHKEIALCFGLSQCLPLNIFLLEVSTKLHKLFKM